MNSDDENRVEDTEYDEVTDTRQVHMFRFRSLLVILLIAIAVPVGVVGWISLYRSYLEIDLPVIVVNERPRGIGLTPVSFQIRISDSETGLHEVRVVGEQKGQQKVIFETKLTGQKLFEREIEINVEQLDLDDSKGPLHIDITAVDRSVWQNVSHYELLFNVDFRKPQVQILSKDVTARRGGSQLILYKAIDENLTISGVKVGNRIYLGDRASGIDKDFSDKSLFVAVYALAQDEPAENEEIRVFAEDVVGNASSESFTLQIAPRPERKIPVAVSPEFLRDQVAALADQNFSKMQEISIKEGQPLTYQSTRGGVERLLEQFQLINSRLRVINENEIISALRLPRSESSWSHEFFMPGGKTQSHYGDKFVFTYQNQPLGEAAQLGMELNPGLNEQEVVAPNDGIVVFSENLGVYGRAVGIDHGLGLTSVCGRLERATVHKGELVKAGSRIGIAGKSGFARFPQVYFEIRVQGTAVDPAEWTDAAWYHSNITNRINQVRKIQGLPVYIPFD